MTNKKALKILGLKETYTEEELKKTYRSLMIMTHPDSANEYDYAYDASDINAAYEYLLKHGEIVHKKNQERKKKDKSQWNAVINNNAFYERDIYHEVEDADGNILDKVIIATGKYMWSKDEDFSLFLLSIYNCSKKIITDSDERTGRDRSQDIFLQGEIAYLLAQQYVNTSIILALTEDIGVDDDGLHMYKIKGMLERTDLRIKLTANEAIYPAAVQKHRLYVKSNNGVVGYVSFKDDRLYYGIIPLFERKAVQVKMKLNGVKDSKYKKSGLYDIEIIIKCLKEDETRMIEAINLKIEKLLEDSLFGN